MKIDCTLKLTLCCFYTCSLSWSSKTNKTVSQYFVDLLELHVFSILRRRGYLQLNRYVFIRSKTQPRLDSTKDYHPSYILLNLIVYPLINYQVKYHSKFLYPFQFQNYRHLFKSTILLQQYHHQIYLPLFKNFSISLMMIAFQLDFHVRL